LVEEEQQKAL